MRAHPRESFQDALNIVEGGAHALFEKPMRAAAQARLAELTTNLTGKRKRV